MAAMMVAAMAVLWVAEATAAVRAVVSPAAVMMAPAKVAGTMVVVVTVMEKMVEPMVRAAEARASEVGGTALAEAVMVMGVEAKAVAAMVRVSVEA